MLKNFSKFLVICSAMSSKLFLLTSATASTTLCMNDGFVSCPLNGGFQYFTGPSVSVSRFARGTFSITYRLPLDYDAGGPSVIEYPCAIASDRAVSGEL